MTYPEFLAQLATTKDLPWIIEWDGALRTPKCCPITAVHGKGLSASNYRRCGQELGLSFDLVTYIALAADGSLSDQSIRRDLLRVLGLQEPQP